MSHKIIKLFFSEQELVTSDIKPNKGAKSKSKAKKSAETTTTTAPADSTTVETPAQ